MPNHVHLILMPAEPDALGRTVGETPRRTGGQVWMTSQISCPIS
jgi:hypothetical protein